MGVEGNLHAMDIFSHKRNEVLTHATTWMDPENLLLSERNQSPKGTSCMTYARCLEEADSETEGKIEVRRGRRGGGWGDGVA